jgi:hypothetical protein
LKPARWSPILEGTLREHALAAVAHTVAQSRDQRGGSPTVADGLSGLALLVIEASRARPQLATRRDAARMMQRILPLAAKVPLTPSLFEGYTGIGLTLELARRAGVSRVASIDEIDRALLAAVESFDQLPPEHAPLDLIGGIAGQALYACARLPRVRARRAIEAIVRWLDRRSLRDADGVTWLSPPRPKPKPNQVPGEIYDLGIAHGIPGILAVLACIVETGVAVRTARRLLDGGTRWVLRQIHRRNGSAFDIYAPREPGPHPSDTLPPSPARLAWCYGDPGAVAALLRVAHVRGDAELRATAMAIADRILGIRDDPSVRDAGLCHGHAGLLHICNRLYQATGEPRARDAAIYWAERTLVVRAGPRAIIEGEVLHPSPYRALRFLMGAAGSALALLAAVSPTAPLWDRFLMLDLPALPFRERGIAPARRVVTSRSPEPPASPDMARAAGRDRAKRERTKMS